MDMSLHMMSTALLLNIKIIIPPQKYSRFMASFQKIMFVASLNIPNYYL
uniref:Uncharacterized protein n=1 Tax=Arundo donax TaxID=35708 RepID=A0A0A9B227_ARUDO